MSETPEDALTNAVDEAMRQAGDVAPIAPEDGISVTMPSALWRQLVWSLASLRQRQEDAVPDSCVSCGVIIGGEHECATASPYIERQTEELRALRAQLQQAETALWDVLQLSNAELHAIGSDRNEMVASFVAIEDRAAAALAAPPADAWKNAQQRLRDFPGSPKEILPGDYPTSSQEKP